MQRTVHRFGITIFLAAMSLSSANAAPPTERLPATSAFSDYVLSLYWLPTLCLETPSADECNGSLHGGFVVHGVWPEKDVDYSRGFATIK
jgi:ribonuclease I